MPRWVAPGHSHHRNAPQAIVSGHLSQQLKPVHVWHDHIEQNGINALTAQDGQRLAPAGGAQHAVPFR